MNVAFMDMDLTIVSPTVKWALPVRPDELGWHLEVYQKTLPALTTLRLCHRFGKGPDAHDTKLPFEILDAIETILCDPKHRAYQDYVRWDNWVESFEHFEGRCAPIDHLYDDRQLDAIDEFWHIKCDSCSEAMEDSDVEEWSDCDDCYDEAIAATNSHMWEDGFTCGDGDGRISGWMKMIDQKPNGNFVQYDDSFGLQAIFLTTRRATGDSWSKHPNHKWHDHAEMKTTICYLTLPGTAMKRKSYTVSELEADCGGAVLRGVRSSILQLPDLSKREKRVKQFRKAMRTLQLEPFVHPSQLQTIVTTEPEPATKRLPNEGESSPTSGDDNVRDLDKTEWPQLVVLAQAISDL